MNKINIIEDGVMDLNKRLEDINKIIDKYNENNKSYPVEYLDLYNEIIAEIEKNEFLKRSRNKYSQRRV